MAASFTRVGFVKSSVAAAVSEKVGPVSGMKSEDLILPPEERWISHYDVTDNATWKASSGPTCGLVNAGNTCFMNSCLQCLAATPPLINYLKSGDHVKDCKSRSSDEFCMTCWAAAFLPKMHAGSSSLFPKLLAHHPHLIARQFRAHRQEDSHEFLRCFIEKMHRVALKTAGVKEGSTDRRDETDAVHRIFGGWFCSQTHCPSCKYDSNRFDGFMDLSLEVGNGINSVQKALQHFASVETLDEDNKWKCPRCNKHVRAEKQMTIRKPPAVLTLQLKRFSFTPKSSGGKSASHSAMGWMAMMMGGGGGQKLQSHVAFPDTLDISPALNRLAKTEAINPLYDLYGVVVHHGSTANSGHYFAFVKAPNGGWYCMNDDSVSKAGWNLVQQQQAYILFYKQKLATLPKVVRAPTVIEQQAAKEESATRNGGTKPPAVPAVKTLDDLSAVAWNVAKPAVSLKAFAPSSGLLMVDEKLLGAAERSASVPSTSLSTGTTSEPPSVALHPDLLRFKLLSDTTTSWARLGSAGWDVSMAWSKSGKAPRSQLVNIDGDVNETVHKIWTTIKTNEEGSRRALRKYKARFLEEALLEAERGADDVEDSLSASDCSTATESAAEQIEELHNGHLESLAHAAPPAKRSRVEESSAREDSKLPASQPVAAAVSRPARKAERQLEQVELKNTRRSAAFDPKSLGSLPALQGDIGSTSVGGWGDDGGWGLASPGGVTGAMKAAQSGDKRNRQDKYINWNNPYPDKETGRMPDEELAASMTEAEWNAMLDAGRLKKVKEEQFESTEPTENRFESVAHQRVQERSALPDGRGYRKGIEAPVSSFRRR